MKRFTFSISLVFLALATLGCESGRDRAPPTSVRVVHAAPSFDDIAFLRVERTEVSELAFRAGSSVSFDADQYTFHAEVTPPGAMQRERVLSFSEGVWDDTTYYFVFTEVDGGLHPLILEAPRDDNGAEQAQVLAVHAGPGLPAIDMYLEPPGTDIGASQPLAELEFIDALEPQELAPGEYELTLTAQGDPADVLMQTTAIELPAEGSSLFTVVDMGGEGVAPVGVVWMRNTSQLLVDRELNSALRMVNAASDRAARAAVIDEDFDEPLLPEVPFGTVSSYEEVPRGEHQLHVTPADSPGSVLEVDEPYIAAGGRMHTLFVTGEPGELDNIIVLDDRRSIGDRARLRLLNGANELGELEFFVVPPEADIDNFFPAAAMNTGGVSVYRIFPPGEYEIVVRRSGTDTVVAGPVAVELEGGGVYGALALDGDGTGEEAQLELYDDFE